MYAELVASHVRERDDVYALALEGIAPPALENPELIVDLESLVAWVSLTFDEAIANAEAAGGRRGEDLA